jgi:hypothetical protein
MIKCRWWVKPLKYMHTGNSIVFASVLGLKDASFTMNMSPSYLN